MITPASKNWIGDNRDYRKPIKLVRQAKGGHSEVFMSVYRGHRIKAVSWPKGRAINERRIREKEERDQRP